MVLYEVGQDGKLTGNKVMKLVSDLDVDTETGELAVLRVPVEQHIALTGRNPEKYRKNGYGRDGQNYCRDI